MSSIDVHTGVLNKIIVVIRVISDVIEHDLFNHWEVRDVVDNFFVMIHLELLLQLLVVFVDNLGVSFVFGSLETG